MAKTLYEKLKEMYGEEFAKKYMEMRRVPVDVLSEEELAKVKELADQLIPQTQDFKIRYKDYDVLLVETPAKQEWRGVKETANGNFYATVIWQGAPGDTNFVNVFGPREVISALEQHALFYIVGKLRERVYQGKKRYTMNCAGVIFVAPLDEEPIEEPAEPSESGEGEFTYEEIFVRRGA